MRKKNYKGAKVSKRVVAKCEGVCRTYDAIQYAYANLLSEAEEVKSFQVNVLLQGLEEGAYTSDFVITKADGNLMVRECVSRKHLTVFCKHFFAKVAKYFWRMLHLQIGESCKASTGSCPASRIAIADQI